jgi:putative colanic acid biosynthesis UDP-glucose lipid carrier transferase
VIALLKEHLNPAIVACGLLLSAASHGQGLTSPYAVLAALAFVVTTKVMSRPRLERVDSRATWWRNMRRTTFEWGCVIAVLLLLGFLLKVTGLFSRKILLTWFVITPFALAGAPAATRGITGWLRRHGGRVLRRPTDRPAAPREPVSTARPFS